MLPEGALAIAAARRARAFAPFLPPGAILCRLFLSARRGANASAFSNAVFAFGSSVCQRFYRHYMMCS